MWALLGYALTRGQRDFSSVTQVVATRYEVLVEHKVAADARTLLAQLPARCRTRSRSRGTAPGGTRCSASLARVSSAGRQNPDGTTFVVLARVRRPADETRRPSDTMTLTTAHLDLASTGASPAGPVPPTPSVAAVGAAPLAPPDQGRSTPAGATGSCDPAAAYVMGAQHVRPGARRLGQLAAHRRLGRVARLVGEGAAVPRPVFVLTHHGYDPVEMVGGTTFHFVTTGFADAAAGPGGAGTAT